MPQNSTGAGPRWAIIAVTFSLLMFTAVEWAWQTFASPLREPSGGPATFTELLDRDGLHAAVQVAGGIVALLLATWVARGFGRDTPGRAAVVAAVRPPKRVAGESIDPEHTFASPQQAAAQWGLPVLVVARPRVGRPLR